MRAVCPAVAVKYEHLVVTVIAETFHTIHKRDKVSLILIICLDRSDDGL